MADPLADAAAANAPVLPPSGGTQHAGAPATTLEEVIASLQAAVQGMALAGQTDTSGGEAAGLAAFLASNAAATGGEDAQVEAAVREWLQELSADPKALLGVQFNLFALGAYGDADPRFGVMDAKTIQVLREWAFTSAWVKGDRTFIEEIAHQNPAGALQARLQDAVRGISSSLISEEMRLDPNPIGAALENPATIIGLLEESYAQVGKRPQAADKRAFIAAFHAFQRDNALADFRYREQLASAATGERVEGVKPMTGEQFTESYAREELGDEPFIAAEATGVVNTLRTAIGGQG